VQNFRHFPLKIRNGEVYSITPESPDHDPILENITQDYGYVLGLGLVTGLGYNIHSSFLDLLF